MVDYKGQQVGFCCKSCIGDFEKDPAKYLAKLKAAQPKS
jgi:YHS domain-containing protein